MILEQQKALPEAVTMASCLSQQNLATKETFH